MPPFCSRNTVTYERSSHRRRFSWRTKTAPSFSTSPWTPLPLAKSVREHPDSCCSLSYWRSRRHKKAFRSLSRCTDTSTAARYSSWPLEVRSVWDPSSSLGNPPRIRLRSTGFASEGTQSGSKNDESQKQALCSRTLADWSASSLRLHRGCRAPWRRLGKRPICLSASGCSSPRRITSTKSHRSFS